MSHILADRVLETSITTGTGAFTLAAAVTGFRRFSAVCAVADTVPYSIEAIDSLGQPTGDYEYGIGTYSSANTLTRTTVEGSSNGGSAVNFSAGSKNVAISANVGGFAGAIAGAGGVVKFPNGWMIQMGTATSNVTPTVGTVVTFPTPFVAAPLVTASNRASSVSGVTVFAGSETATDFTLASSVASLGCTWFAMGRWK